MDGINNYLQIMIESLQKKDKILEDIRLLVISQAEILGKDTIDQVEFDNSMARKSDLINELDRLNVGFEELYERIKAPLLSEKEKYTSYIKQLQDLISKVSEKSILIQTMEERNMAKADSFFRGRQQEIRSLRRSNSVARSYQQTMTGQAYAGVYQFDTGIDKKK